MYRKQINHEQVEKHVMQCFRRATYRKYIFEMARAGVCESDRTLFLSRTVHGCLSRFLNCTNGTKSRKGSHKASRNSKKG